MRSVVEEDWLILAHHGRRYGLIGGMEREYRVWGSFEERNNGLRRVLLSEVFGLVWSGLVCGILDDRQERTGIVTCGGV